MGTCVITTSAKVQNVWEAIYGIARNGTMPAMHRKHPQYAAMHISTSGNCITALRNLAGLDARGHGSTPSHFRIGTPPHMRKYEGRGRRMAQKLLS